jgi:hypothetical protein
LELVVETPPVPVVCGGVLVVGGAVLVAGGGVVVLGRGAFWLFDRELTLGEVLEPVCGGGAVVVWTVSVVGFDVGSGVLGAVDFDVPVVVFGADVDTVDLRLGPVTDILPSTILLAWQDSGPTIAY